LIGSALLSLGVTDNYDSYKDRAGSIRAPNDVPLWKDPTLDDAGERIRVALNAAPNWVQRHDIQVIPDGGRGTRTDTMIATPPDDTRQTFEVLAAALFALFGLFVLWWGRDRASLWLGIFCASLGPVMIPFYGALPAPAMLVAALAGVLLESIAIYALYALAEAVALDSIAPDDPVRKVLHGSRVIAVGTVVVIALVGAGAMLMPVVRREAFPDALASFGAKAILLGDVGVLTLAPLVFLTVAVLRARDDARRNRALVILATTAFALCGVVYSLVTQLWQTGQAGFDTPWFTLLAIPIGFIVTIPAYRVVEVKVVVNRILVITGMALIIGAIITVTETWAHGEAVRGVERMIDPAGTRHDAIAWAIEFTVACTIVLSFSSLHRFLEAISKRIIFRRRDEGIAALHDFAVHRASFVTSRKALIDQTVVLAAQAVGAQGAAIYEECSGGYERSAATGTWPWPALADVDDPAFVALRSEAERLELEAMLALKSALGSEGVALRMAIGGRVTGALVVAPRENEGDGPYVRDELDALDDIARSIADALFTLRSSETTAFVQAVADGRLSGIEARRRAEALCACEPDAAASAQPARALSAIETSRPA
jgi:hypothetical protein